MATAVVSLVVWWRFCINTGSILITSVWAPILFEAVLHADY